MASGEKPNRFSYRHAHERPGQKQDSRIIPNSLEGKFETPLLQMQKIIQDAEEDLGGTLRDYHRTIEDINKLSAELKKLKETHLLLQRIVGSKEKIRTFEAERIHLLGQLQELETTLKKGRGALASMQTSIAEFRESWLPHLNS